LDYQQHMQHGLHTAKMMVSKLISELNHLQTKTISKINYNMQS